MLGKFRINLKSFLIHPISILLIHDALFSSKNGKDLTDCVWCWLVQGPMQWNPLSSTLLEMYLVSPVTRLLRPHYSSSSWSDGRPDVKVALFLLMFFFFLLNFLIYWTFLTYIMMIFFLLIFFFFLVIECKSQKESQHFFKTINIVIHEETSWV